MVQQQDKFEEARDVTVHDRDSAIVECDRLQAELKVISKYLETSEEQYVSTLEAYEQLLRADRNSAAATLE